LSTSGAPAQEAGRTAGTTITLSPTQAAQLLISNDRLDDAKRLLGQMLAAKPDDSEALVSFGHHCGEQKDYGTAIVALFALAHPGARARISRAG